MSARCARGAGATKAGARVDARARSASGPREQIATIDVPEQPSNVTFGGRADRTLFITARTGFYAIDMKVKGQPRVAGPNRAAAPAP